MRAFDRDLIRGGHYGQRSCEPHQQAEHMAAPTNAAFVKKVLANSEPSTHGPKRTFPPTSECPLLGVKRTSKFDYPASAFDPSRTSYTSFCCVAQRTLTPAILVTVLSREATREAARFHHTRWCCCCQLAIRGARTERGRLYMLKYRRDKAQWKVQRDEQTGFHYIGRRSPWDTTRWSARADSSGSACGHAFSGQH
jgi:hypothetical protein